MPASLGYRWGVLLLALFSLGCPNPQRVVLYSAQDKEFADQILADFEKQSSLPVAAHFDSEANKTVGIYDDLVREAKQPRCDVHWNNEIIGTIRLQRLGILSPYDSPAAKPFPPSLRASDHTWTAFAGRARVLILNTDLLTKLGIPEAEWPRSLLDLTHPRWRGQVAMSKPLAGTNATQAACLFQVWGKDKAMKWYRDLRANDIKIVPGNKQAAEGVGQGQFAIALTDTDDAMAEIDAGRPVRIVFPDRDAPEGSKLGTLFIPNTVAVIKGSPHPEGAQRLVDFLLSPQVEKKLAESGSRQIPLNPNVRAALPKQLETPSSARPLPVDFERAADLWDEVQTFLREEFLR